MQMGGMKEATSSQGGFDAGKEPCDEFSVYVSEVENFRGERMIILHYCRYNDVSGDDMSKRRTFPAFKLHRPSSELYNSSLLPYPQTILWLQCFKDEDACACRSGQRTPCPG
jgi:hypothetical protein